MKERLEMPVATQKTDTGLTPGLLRVLNKQVTDSPEAYAVPSVGYWELLPVFSLEPFMIEMTFMKKHVPVNGSPTQFNITSSTFSLTNFLFKLD